jgi:pilus assembly protein CpaF
VSVPPDLLERVRRRVAAGGAPPTAARVADALREEGGLRGDAELLTVLRLLQSEIAGAGPLQPLLADADVTDVLVNGPHEVWVDRGHGLERTRVRFPDDAAVRRLAQRLSAPSGRRLDDAQPWVDARLPGGVRLHAVLAPVAAPGTCVSLRVPRRRVFSLEELVAAATLPPDGAVLLRRLVQARTAFLVTGGTGTGKTTLLAALLSLADPGDRLLLVEDAAELAPDHPHVVRLEARAPNVEGAGAVTLRDLVRQALRMRPDRLVVGEVRGAEVVDLLAALNTGHEGGAGTLHANSAEDVPARLEALAAAAGLDRAALHSQVAAGLRVVVHLVRARGGGSRRVAQLCVLSRGTDGLVRAVPGWSWDGRSSAGAPGAAAQALSDLLSG